MIPAPFTTDSMNWSVPRRLLIVRAVEAEGVSYPKVSPFRSVSFESSVSFDTSITPVDWYPLAERAPYRNPHADEERQRQEVQPPASEERI